MADTLKADDRIPIPTTPVSIPRLGFGTYQILGIEAKKATLTAIQVGYGQIDSAQSYRNESQVQAAVSESGVPREDLFLTTKVYLAYGDSAKTYQNALSSIEALGGKGGYADLVLIHTPGSKKEFRQELWATLEKLHAEGRAKTIGVSNYRIHHIEEMKEYAKIWPPHVQQIELHPWCQQRELVSYCRTNNIVIQAYSPLSRGSKLEDPQLASIADKYGKQPAQVLIRWSLQKDWVPLPKSATPERIKANFDVFDFALDDEDVLVLDELDEGANGAEFPANVSSSTKLHLHISSESFRAT